MAERAGMSRSTFSLKFKETVGTSPMEYLTNWRMILAGNKLTNSNDSVSMIAEAMGYESESAFSTAFKRVIGCSPRQYGRQLAVKYKRLEFRGSAETLLVPRSLHLVLPVEASVRRLPT